MCVFLCTLFRFFRALNCAKSRNDGIFETQNVVKKLTYPGGNLRIVCWNCWSYSNERHAYCKSLKYDILALTELRNKQNNPNFNSKFWIPSAQAETKQGKCTDPAAGVAILLSKRLSRHIERSGHVGTRIAWVRLCGPVCPIFFIVVYVPHKYRATPKASDTLYELNELLKTVPKNDSRLIVCGDFNCQLRRNVPGCTGQWSMTKKNEDKGHDQQVLDIMRTQDLFAVETRFMPKTKLWSEKKRRCNATYMPKHTERRPTKLDYFLVSNRWQSMVTAAKTKWSAAYHRFGSKFDHALISIEWKWRLRMSNSQPRPCFESMTTAKWAEFDQRLTDRLAKLKGDVEVTEQEMGAHYDRLTNCINETVKEVVSPKTQKKFNGRKASAKTKRLYELRTRDFASGREIKKSDRDAWNKTLNKAAKKDYDEWVENWVGITEEEDERGDVRTVHEGARALAGKSKTFQGKQPTKNKQGDILQSSEELGDLWQQFLADKFAVTDIEAARKEYVSLETEQGVDTLSYEEFEAAVDRMKNRKATGPDGVPAEVWKNSALAKQELYFFL